MMRCAFPRTGFFGVSPVNSLPVDVALPDESESSAVSSQ
jgi:hypothetical protein